MLYRKPINKLQKFIQKQSYLHIGVLLATLLSIILFSWVALSQQPVTLNLLMTAPDAEPWRQGLIRDFEAENPGIRINLVEGPNATNLLEDLYTSSFILGESPYDLINMDVIWTSKFAAAGWLLPLDDRISKQELGAFSSQDVEGGRYQNKLYRIPVRSDVGMLYYREDLIQQAGLKSPETFDDLIRISQVLQKKKEVNWGYVWQGRQYEGLVAMFAEVLDGFGGFWVNPDTLEVGLDRPETLQAIEFLRSTIREGISPPGVTTYQEEDTRRLFQSGQVAFLRSWPYAWPLAQAENSPIRGKIAIKPMVHAPGQTGAGSLGGWGLGISKTSRHPEEAWKAIQYFTSREAQRRFIFSAGYVPSRRDLFTDPEIVAKYPHYPQLLEVVDNAVLRPPIAQYAQTSDILQRYLSAALSGRINSERAMQAAAAETRRLLGAGGVRS
ncbi:ABC transporter substrate-binding protein [Nostoc sp. CHAB 5715]|uniref:ABC transporter substrate-binding protein n=1 Tax=Nostoc sp. CHAB 5715 TaxID=2780400 RepID=UPI001E4405D5|nr:ABC transporter substrate-binding protein [Nostoc sp. CHAB 5715]MCC5621416.1 ABC transporter substrate-binding protein [Nostoc sp. CHAB 5715]